METMYKRIGGLSLEETARMARLFGVTKRYVAYALSYNSNHCNDDKAKRIRCFALQKGGYDVVTLPMSEMMHDSDGHMRQYYANGMTLDCDKKSGLVKLMDRDGKTLGSWGNPTISELERIQKRAAAMNN